jgi:hypothetical protein
MNLDAVFKWLIARYNDKTPLLITGLNEIPIGIGAH